MSGPRVRLRHVLTIRGLSTFALVGARDERLEMPMDAGTSSTDLTCGSFLSGMRNASDALVTLRRLPLATIMAEGT